MGHQQGEAALGISDDELLAGAGWHFELIIAVAMMGTCRPGIMLVDRRDNFWNRASISLVSD